MQRNRDSPNLRGSGAGVRANERIARETGYGLALEGASAAALVKAGREQTREQGK